MVRTAATGIRVSAGKSSKKVGGGSATNSSAGSGSSKSGGSSTKLPPISHQETPAWQKPITSFFKSNSPLKPKENKNEGSEEGKSHEQVDNKGGPSKKKLKFDKDDSTESEKHVENLDDEDVLPGGNKENSVKNSTEFDEGAGPSKE